MSVTSTRMYELLPAIIRQRDLERGEPLRALFDVLGRQGQVVEDDLARLYDNLFIETCDPWVVPYLADLLGVRGLNDTGAIAFSARARVANTLGFRRRKGTAAMLEELAVDTTGWKARVVEFFELLATTQWLNHIRLQSVESPDLRRGDALERIGTAFGDARHYVDVRRIARGRGRYNLPNVGIFLWRLEAQELDARATARAPGAGDARGRFFIDPLGIDAPLFNRPQAETTIESVATEVNVPGPLRRRPLYDELEARRRAIVNGEPITERWFGSTPAFSVAYRLQATDPMVAVPAEEVVIANLSESTPPIPEVWRRPPATLPYLRQSDQTMVDMPIQVAVDPALGRAAFPAGVVPAEVRVSAARAFPGDVGGGSYDRRDTIARFELPATLWAAAVGRDLVDDGTDPVFNRFEDAIDAWNSRPAGATGLITIVDNGTYAHGGVIVRMRAKSRLYITSADWPRLDFSDGTTRRVPGRITPSGRWAHLVGKITVQSELDARLWLDGLLIEGDVDLSAAGGAGLTSLRLTNTTVVPGRGEVVVRAGHTGLCLQLERSVVGAVTIAGLATQLCVIESAVDTAGGAAIDAPEVPVEIAGSTIVGTTQARQLDASNSIFMDVVTVERRQEGCVRFSFVPAGSTVPRRHRCQPDLALEQAEPAKEAQVLASTVPDFVDETYGGPAYLQLTRSTPVGIRTGADDGAEMGVWWFLRQPQRESNLLSSLDEYLRLGLEAGLIYVT